MYNLLLVDDDNEVLDINSNYLKNDGYNVETACTAAIAFEKLKSFTPDCILLDIMMPEMNGFDACVEFRKSTNAPIIFLTGKTTEEDKIKGLMLGGDDYIIKPYSLGELSARVFANIRRHQSTTDTVSTLSYPPLFIDIVNHKVLYNSDEIFLSNREYELLLLLASNPNQTITYEDVSKKMWGVDCPTDRRSVMVHVSRLRKRLETYKGLENIIETVWSEGYKFTY